MRLLFILICVILGAIAVPAESSLFNKSQKECCALKGGVAGCDDNTGKQICRDGTLSESCVCVPGSNISSNEEQVIMGIAGLKAQDPSANAHRFFERFNNICYSHKDEPFNQTVIRIKKIDHEVKIENFMAVNERRSFKVLEGNLNFSVLVDVFGKNSSVCVVGTSNTLDIKAVVGLVSQATEVNPLTKQSIFHPAVQEKVWHLKNNLIIRLGPSDNLEKVELVLIKLK